MSCTELVKALSDRYQGAEVECCTLMYDCTPVYYKVTVHVYDNFVIHLKTLSYMCEGGL